VNIDIGGNLDSLVSIVRKQVEEKWKALQDVADEGARFGAKTAQSYTLTRPGATTGKAGRVDSGAMVAALRPGPVTFSADLIETQYGFVDDVKDYYKYQTVTGFQHNRSSRYIGPTFALRDSIGPTRDFVRQAAGSI
jgi:hypothetical protein